MAGRTEIQRGVGEWQAARKGNVYQCGWGEEGGRVGGGQEDEVDG